MFTAWYGLIPYIKQITFRLLKVKATPSAGKVMATIFWDAEGLILVDIMSCDQTISSDLYIQTLNTLRTGDADLRF